MKIEDMRDHTPFPMTPFPPKKGGNYRTRFIMLFGLENFSIQSCECRLIFPDTNLYPILDYL